MAINFELLDLRVFLAILDLGGFHRAAEALNLSQPALSRRLQALEATIGTPLLERTTRRVEPTRAGRLLEPLARRVIAELEEQMLAVSGGGQGSGQGSEQGGSLTIASVPTAVFYFLPAVIERFAASFPRFRVRILDLSAHEVDDAVTRREAEFGINLIGASDPDLSFTPLLDDPFVLACRRDHRFATQDRVAWADLANERLVGVSRTSGNRIILESALARAGIRLDFFYEVNHLSTSLGLVERGLGVSVLPRLATPPEGHPIIATRPLAAPEVRRGIGIVERRAGRLSPVAARFRAMLLEHWRAGPDSPASLHTSP